MRLPHQRSFAPDHLEKLGGVRRMVYRAVLRALFDETRAGGAPVRPVHRFGEEEIIMAAEIDIGLLAGQNPEIAVRMPAARLVVITQVFDAQPAVVFRMSIAVEIVNHDDVDAEIADGGNPR